MFFYIACSASSLHLLISRYSVSSAGQGDEVSIAGGKEGNTIDISLGRSKRGIDSVSSLLGICIYYKNMSRYTIVIIPYLRGSAVALAGISCYLTVKSSYCCCSCNLFTSRDTLDEEAYIYITPYYFKLALTYIKYGRSISYIS